jgi:O-antigen/teichoic acid export membrane protein
VVFVRYGIVTIFVGVLLGELWGIIYFAYINRENMGFQYDFSYLKKALKYSIPTLPAILAGWIDSSVGQIFIGKYVSMADLGVYSIALSFASIFSLISIGLNNTWGPFLFENYKKEGFSQQVNNLFVVIVSGLIVVSVSVSLLSKELVLLFSNPSYIKASEYIALLCISMCIYLLFPIASSGIQISRDTKYIGIAYVVGSLFNILSLVILLPYWGIVTVPISLAFSRIVSYAIQYVVTRKNKILELPNQYVVVLILCSVLSYFIVCSGLSFWWRILIVVLFDGGMLFILNKRFSAIAKILAKIKRN